MVRGAQGHARMQPVSRISPSVPAVSPSRSGGQGSRRLGGDSSWLESEAGPGRARKVRGALRELPCEAPRQGALDVKRWTREQQNSAWRRWYRDNTARKIGWQARRREEMRRWWKALKAGKACERCGETAPECLQFHHRDPSSKDLDLARVVANGWSRERTLAEVAKCEVLCANCHLKQHWNESRRSGWRDSNSRPEVPKTPALPTALHPEGTRIPGNSARRKRNRRARAVS